MRHRFIALIVGVALPGWPADLASSEADDDLESKRPLLERAWTVIRDGRASLPAFLRDTTLTMRLRSHFGDVNMVTGTEREAWASGGWVAYRSGWLLDAAQIGATYDGSAPVYAPADKDGTLLLAPGQSPYHVFGEAFASLRYRQYALFKGYRQSVKQPFINALDNRMTPNTFEGLTLSGSAGPAEYFAAYLTKIKLRNADQFVAMSEAAGAPGTHFGVALLTVTVAPLAGLSIKIAEQYGVNTFNTALAHIERTWTLDETVQLMLGAQLIDQRAVGGALVATTRVTRWVTRNESGRVAIFWGSLTVAGAVSNTAAGNRIQTPWGVYPGYLQLAQQYYDNANEKAWRLGAGYDFSKVILRGLTAALDFAHGVDSINPVTRAPLGNESEWDLKIDYRPPKVEGLRLRLIGILYDRTAALRRGYQIRSVLDWDVALL